VSPSIAYLMIQGAIRLSCVKPAMKVCVPHAPNGAYISKRFPPKLRPYWRVRLVLTDVSSIKTSRSGCFRMVGRWCLNQFPRRFFTRAHSRSVATNDFFCNCIQACSETGRWMPNAQQHLLQPPGLQLILAT
jgi:hypothetical protein